ncbi:MAG: response regulator transcription factor [Syntrophobacterales bacterium]|nr:response regulator transcription factor [Syntrophobacterales bacterium]
MKAETKKRILIVEDDLHIAEGLRLNLSLRGYDISIAADGMAALRMWREWRPQLIVLDIMLPGIDGLSVLRHIRIEDEKLPILILSAKNEPEYRVKGLTYGVDDYLAKPFHLDEFLLRVDRLLTRAEWSRETGDGKNGRSGLETTYSFGGNTIHFDTFTVSCRAGEVRLTEQEMRLLKLFIANRGKPLSRSELLEMGWGYTGATPTRTVDNFIVRFRKYFEDDPQHPRYFKSLRSIGYVFDHD